MKKKILSCLMVAVIGITMFTGCGSEPAAESKAPEVAELDSVRLQLKWLPQSQFMGYYVAEEKGYYEEEGIDIEILPGGPDIIPANQVSVGSADFAVSNLYSLLPFIEKGYPLVDVAQIFQVGSFRLVSLAKTGIESVEDLKGKTVGAWLGTGDYPIYAMLEKYGIDKDNDLTIAKQDYTMDGLIRGTFDAASAQLYNEYLVLLESGYDESDINVIDVNEEGVAMLEDCLIANTEWLAENEELATRFIRATIKGWADACADPVGAAEIVWSKVDQSSTTLEHQTGMAEKIAEIVVPEGFDSSQIGYMDPNAIQRTIDIAVKYKIVQEAPADIYVTNIWEDAVK